MQTGAYHIVPYQFRKHCFDLRANVKVEQQMKRRGGATRQVGGEISLCSHSTGLHVLLLAPRPCNLQFQQGLVDPSPQPFHRSLLAGVIDRVKVENTLSQWQRRDTTSVPPLLPGSLRIDLGTPNTRMRY